MPIGGSMKHPMKVKSVKKPKGPKKTKKATYSKKGMWK